MIGLYLLTAHLTGDFLIQPSWMAAGKLDSARIRAMHVVVYSVPFLGLLLLYAADIALTFVLVNAVVHYGIDSRRWAEPKESWQPPEMWTWLVDQVIHLIQITVLGFLVLGY